MGIRVTQTAVEALVQPTTQKLRVTQLAVEALVQPTTQRVRVTQLAVEVLIQPTGTLAGEEATVASAATDLVLNVPSGAKPGQVLIAQVNYRGGDTQTITVPTGWNTAFRVDNGPDVGLAVYWKVVADDEPASHTWSFSSAAEVGGGISAYSKLSRGNPIESYSTAVADGTTVDLPSIDYSDRSPGVVVMAAGNESSSASAEWTPPTGFTETRDISTTTGVSTDRISVTKAGKGNSGAGSTGLVQAAAASGNKKVAAMLALRDDSASGRSDFFFLM